MCEVPVVVTRPTSICSAHEGVCVSLDQVVVPVETKSFIVIVHLKSDWSPQTPIDVQQPLEDKLSILLQTHTRNNNYQHSWSEGISCWPPATAAQYQVYVQKQTHTAFTGCTLSSWRKPVRFDPPISFFFFLTQYKDEVTSEKASNNEKRK